MRYPLHGNSSHRNWIDDMARSKDYTNSEVTVRPIDEEALKKFEKIKPDSKKQFEWPDRDGAKRKGG